MKQKQSRYNNVYQKDVVYSDEIELEIANEIDKQKYEDSRDGKTYTDREYREFAIDNLIGNGIIK